MRTWLRWLLVGSSGVIGHIRPWNAVIAARHAAVTERLLLGSASPPQVIGNRAHEAVMADRERRNEAMTWRA